MNASLIFFPRYRKITFLLVLIFATNPVISPQAESQVPAGVPPELNPWVDWVRSAHQDFTERSQCSSINSNGSSMDLCLWTYPMSLHLDNTGGRFSFQVTIDPRESESTLEGLMVKLPGQYGAWPLDVTIENTADKTIENPVVLNNAPSDTPYIKLKPGNYKITGIFRWTEIPDRLQVPEDTIVSSILIDRRSEIHGRKESNVSLASVSYDSAGRLILGGTRFINSDVLSISRRVSDGAPTTIETRLRVLLEGEPGEIDLAPALLDHGVELGIESGQESRHTKEGTWLVSLSPGENLVVFKTLFPAPITSVSPKTKPSEGWSDVEYWSFPTRKEYRSFTLEGGLQADPKMVDVPLEWGGDQLRVLTGNEELLLREKKSVRPEIPTNLSIARTSWLNPSDGKVAHREIITGEIGSLMRLDFKPARKAQFIHDSGQSRLITASTTGDVGVEVRTPVVRLATGSLEEVPHDSFHADLPISGLSSDAENLEWELRVPYGWTILHATGADTFVGLWWQQFSPMAVILICGNFIGSLAIWGVPMAILLLLCSVVGIDTQFPAVVLLGNCFLITQKTLFRKLNMAELSLAIIKSLFLISFLWALVYSIYPDIQGPAGDSISSFNNLPVTTNSNGEANNYTSGYFAKANYIDARVSESADVILTFVNRSFGALIMIAAGIGGIISALFGQHRAAAGLLIVATGSFMVRSLVSSWFNDSTLSSEGYSIYQPSSAYHSPSVPFNTDGSSTGNGFSTPETSKPDTLNIPQTGKALPSWTGKTIFLTWKTGATASKSLQLFFLPAYVLIAIKSVLLMLLLILTSGRFLQMIRITPMIFIILMAMSIAPSGYAEFPPQYLLDELANRIRQRTPVTENIRCSQPCHHLENLMVSIENNMLTLTARVHSEGESIWPIPVEIQVTDVSINGITSPVHGNHSLGTLVRIQKGINQVTIHGEVLPSKALNFDLQPGYLELNAPGWRVSNERPLRLLPLNQEAKGGESAKWFILRRDISVGRTWSISNTLSPLGNSQGESLIQIPLLKEERVLNSSPDVRTRRLDDGSGVVQVKLKDVEKVVWSSQISPSDSINIPSLGNIGVSQYWQLSCRDDYKCNSKTTAVALKDAPGFWEWEAAAGQSLEVQVHRLTGITGKTKTLLYHHLHLNRGERTSETTLELSYVTSVAQQESIQYPDGARLVEAVANGQPAVVKNLDKHHMVFDLDRGRTNLTLKFVLPNEESHRVVFPRIIPESSPSDYNYSFQHSASGWLTGAGGTMYAPVSLTPWYIVSLVILNYFITPLVGVSFLSLTALSFCIVFGFQQQILWYVALVACTAYIKHRGDSLYVAPLVALGSLAYVAMSCISLAVEPSSTVDFADRMLRWSTTDATQIPWIWITPTWIHGPAVFFWFAVFFYLWRRSLVGDCLEQFFRNRIGVRVGSYSASQK